MVKPLLTCLSRAALSWLLFAAWPARRKKLLLITLLLACNTSSRAATLTALSPSHADVSAAIASSVTGDTVMVPPGTAIWTNVLTVVEKGILLLGSGTNSTIIIDENPVRVTSPTLFNITWSRTNLPGAMFHLSGFQFQGGTTNTTASVVGLIRFNGSDNFTNNSTFRVSSNWFNLPRGRPMQIRAWNGLVDDNAYDMGTQAGISVDCRMNATQEGDVSWSQPSLAGTTNMVVFERETVLSSTSHRAFIDGFAGARFAVRHCTLNNRSVENHGTESTQRARSGRWMEVYENTMTASVNGEWAVLFRGGSGVVFNNTVSGGGFPGLVRMIYLLSTDGYQPWRQANGTNVWDSNVAGGPFATGTHTGANGATVLTDSTKTFTIDQWTGFSIQNLSGFYTNGAVVGRLAGLIDANTATTITTKDSVSDTYRLIWNTGDSYQVWRVDKALDAPGRGEGALLSGGSDTTPPTPTTWPAQIDEPIYAWDNTGMTNMASGTYPIVAGRDYISGAARPGYTPLVYPHPLTGSAPYVPPVPVPALPGRSLLLLR